MRTAGATATFVLTLGLLVGSAGSAAAQDEEPAAASSSLTGAFTTQLDVVSEGTVNAEPNGLDETSGFVLMTSWVATDPRLTGAVTYTGNWVIDTNSPEGPFGPGSMLLALTYELTNDGGSWLGEARGIRNAELDIADDVIVLESREGYEGLTAYAVVDHRPFPAEFAGTTFPTSMPDVPEPYVAE